MGKGWSVIFVKQIIKCYRGGVFISRFKAKGYFPIIMNGLGSVCKERGIFGFGKGDGPTSLTP